MKYGYGRVTMHDLARAARMSRPALYLVFAKKEEVFCGVVRQVAHDTAGDVKLGLGSARSLLDKLKFVCEIWMVRPFDWISRSGEAKEIFESSYEFARDAAAEGRSLFESDLISVIAQFPKGALPEGVSNRQAAHLLAGAIGGVKKSCGSATELRNQIDHLITMMIRA